MPRPKLSPQAVPGIPANTNDTLPLCPVCGTPPLPGRIGGFFCLTPNGKLRRPHAARVIAWGRELAALEAEQ